MAELTEAQVLEAVERIKQAFADGFQLADLSVLLREITTFAELFSLSGGEKKALAIRVAEKVLDETDTPWLPDALLDPLLKKLMPNLIDLVVDATKGKLKLNDSEATA